MPCGAPTLSEVTSALVSQTMYQNVRDDYAVYFFKEEAEAPVLALCESKEDVMLRSVSISSFSASTVYRPASKPSKIDSSLWKI